MRLNTWCGMSFHGKVEIMMNLCEFLENLVPECRVTVEMGGVVIFCSKVCDISEDDSCMYWIPPGSVNIVGDGVLHIPAVHQDEINKRIEEERRNELERKGLEDFSGAITDHADSIRQRAGIWEAIVWAQEHHNQIMYLSDHAEDASDLKRQLMEQYGFNINQAEMIAEMRNRAFTIRERKRAQEEMQILIGIDEENFKKITEGIEEQVRLHDDFLDMPDQEKEKYLDEQRKKLENNELGW